jgi:hypothetical protein
MALRIYPMSASRWAQLSATRLPIDLTEPDEDETPDRSRRAEGEIARIQAYVDALHAASASASR